MTAAKTATKVLVTGGGGFIGSHVVDRLLELGHHVMVVDDFRSGRLSNVPSGVTLYRTDLAAPALDEGFREERPGAVILDPARWGCHSDALDALVKSQAPRIVYVSCDPDALARDLDRLVSGGYVVDSVEPLDMFPQTHHVECLATLTFSSRHG